MKKTILKNELLRLKKIICEDGINVFQTIINQDEYSFRLMYVSERDIAENFIAGKYDRFILDNQAKEMGACNFEEDLYNESDFSDYGIKISDPNCEVLGAFHFRGKSIIYSPIVPRVFEERDYIKYSQTTYYTSMTMPDIINEQLKKENRFFVHIGEDYNMRVAQLVKNGNRHILEEISGAEMFEFATNPDAGVSLLKRYLNCK